MNTFWLKIAGIAVFAVLVIVVVGMFSEGTKEPEPKPDEKTFYDQVERDKDKFLTEPEPVEQQDQQPAAQTDTAVANQTDAQPTQPPQPVQEPPKPVTLYFKKLNEIDEVEASRYLNAAAPARSMGRLQIGYKNMVDNCRRIIQKWPDSWYAYRAQQMLIDMPERYYERYKVTEEEKDLSRFTVQRPGTTPFTDEGSR